MPVEIAAGVTVIVEARHRTGHAVARTGRCRAGILHQLGILRMLEGSLAFAVVVEAEFVDQCCY